MRFQFLVRFILVLPAAAVLAAASANEPAKPPLKREAILGDLAHTRATLAERGVEFGLHATHEYLGVVHGGIRRQGKYNGLLQLDLDLDLGKLIGWPGATIHATGFNGFGPSLSGRDIGDESNVSNINMRNGTRLFEAWLQQQFGSIFSIRAGLLATDSEFADSSGDFISSRGGALFVNGDFGAIPIMSFNLPEPIFPNAAPGVSMTLTPARALTFRAAIYDGQPLPTDEFDDRNAHGFSPRLDAGDGALIIAEFAFAVNKPHSTDSDSPAGKESVAPRGLGGIYKLGAFYHSGAFTRWQQDRDRRGNGGGYFVAHQMLWRENERDHQGLCLFARVGVAPRDRNVLDLDVEVGVHYHGLIPGRDEDDFGVGVSTKRYSSDFSAAERRAGNPGRDRETIIEASYSAQVTRWLSVQPDLQYVMRPAGQQTLDDAVVAGVRVSIDF